MSETLALSRGLPSTIREGEILGGKYRLEKEIGRGAMGTVWSAVHLTLGQRVAIKLIAAEHAQAIEARQRFSTEAKAAARLRSRYVVQVYDDGETPAGTPYIVLEYLEGETLEQRLERERDLPLNDAVRITRHVGRALSRAHAQGIVHRDLKPGNVFLTRSDDDELGWLAKVLDFGIAKLEEHGIASTTKTGTLLGTPLFMSPEQVRGASSVDSRSDLYSLGMVFYNMMTGAYAFNGESFADVLVAICTGPLPDLRAAAPWIPGSVADWFVRACARDPNDRFQSADEMVEGLELALGVSTGAFNRQSSPEVKLDTLRGHAPPVHHSIPRATPSDSGEFAKNATQVHGMDPALLSQGGGNSARTLDPEPSIPTASRVPLLIGIGFALLLILGSVVFVLGRGNPTDPTLPAQSSASANANASALVAPPPPVTVAAPAPTPPIPAPPEPAVVASSAPGVSAPPVKAPARAHSAPVPARASKAGQNTPASAPASPRNTSTDMGF
ncbi:MAG: serine/threonine-protein kinase [Myxococcales bacterium]